MIQTIRHIQTKDGADLTARLVLNGSRLGRYSFNPHYTHKERTPRIEFFDPLGSATALGTYVTEYGVRYLATAPHGDVVLVQRAHTLDHEVVAELLLWAEQQARQIH